MSGLLLRLGSAWPHRPGLGRGNGGALAFEAGRGRRALVSGEYGSWWRAGRAVLPLVLAGVMAVSAVVGQEVAGVPGLDLLRREVASLAAAPTVATGTLGFYLASLEEPDRALVQRSARQSFITASTMKTLTTGVALERLGPDFAFATRVTSQAATGDVVIHGAGDPSLGRDGWQELFTEWLDGLRQAGVTEVTGRVVADESAWEPQEIPDGWTWQDIGNYYAPPMTPLSFHDNEFRLWYELLGRPGEPAGLYDVEPWPDGLRIIDALVVGAPGTGDEAYAYGGPGDSRYTVRGTLAPDAGKEFIRVALPDPAFFCAQQFVQFLQAHQIPVRGGATTTRRLAAAGTRWAAAEGRPVAVHRSAPLRDLLVPINHLSLNLDCECLLRTLGGGRAQAGLAVLRDHLASQGLPLAGYQQTDGSGLSRTNMVTPELLARAQAAVLSGPQGAAFLASLPVVTPGRNGAPTGTRTAVIRAKSGSIERVKGYTGVVETADGRRYVFAALVNNYDGPYDRDVGPGLRRILAALAGL